MRSYKFRLYPNHAMEQKLVETLDGCRWLYNYFLTIRATSEYDLNYTLTDLKEWQPWLYNYHSKMLQMVAKRVAANMSSLKTLQKNGHKAGKLHYLMHHEYNSFTYNQSGFRIERRSSGTNLLWLSKIGYIEIRLHRRPVNITQVTVCRQAGKWYAAVACEIRVVFRLVDPRKSIGIDVGVTRFSYDSVGGTIEIPYFLQSR